MVFKKKQASAEEKKRKTPKNQRVIIDVGTHSAKVLSAAYSKGSVIINQAETIKGIDRFMDENTLVMTDPLAEEVARAIGINNPKKKLPATLLISSPHSGSAVFKVPDDQKKKAKKYIFQHLDAMTLDDINYNTDYTNLGNQYYLVAFVPSDLARELVLSFQKTGFNITAIDAASSALIYLSNLYKDDEFETKIFLGIGYRSSEILVEHQEHYVKFEKIPLGVFQMAEEVSDSLGVPFAQTINLFFKLGLNKNSLPSNAGELLDEFNVTESEYSSAVHSQTDSFIGAILEGIRVEGVTLKASSSKIILLGGGSLIKGVGDILHENANVTTAPFDLVSSIRAGSLRVVNDTNRKIDGLFSHAVGLALREVFGK
jgi:Tfp pilus assembly PilM family ATPase